MCKWTVVSGGLMVCLKKELVVSSHLCVTVYLGKKRRILEKNTSMIKSSLCLVTF